MLSLRPHTEDYSRPPTPHYILRGHLHPVTQLSFSLTRPNLLFSGDSSGTAVIWNLGTYRPLVVWTAHQDSILSLSQLGTTTLITHARDNKLHLFDLEQLTAQTQVRGTFENPVTIEPVLDLDVNALNFCRLSLLDLTRATANSNREGLIAVTSLTKDDHVDIFHVPSKDRLHRSIGISSLLITGAGGEQKSGSVMAVHLLYLPSSESQAEDSTKSTSATPSADSEETRELEPTRRKKTLHLLIGYESGQLALLEFTPTRNFAQQTTSPPTATKTPSMSEELERESDLVPIAFPVSGRMIEENEGWSLVWVEKSHRDAVMSIEVSPDEKFVYTVGADHLLVKYRLWDLNEEEAALQRSHVETTESPGKSTIRSRLARSSTARVEKGTKSSSSEILAVGGWNGEVRVYSGKTLEPLACLDHHRNSVQALDFAPVDYPSLPPSQPRGSTEVENESGSEETDDEEDGCAGTRGVLATGGIDTKICLWKIYPP